MHTEYKEYIEHRLTKNWSKEQRKKLSEFYSTLIPEDGIYTIQQLVSFWKIYYSQFNHIPGFYQTNYYSDNPEITEYHVKSSFIILSEYDWLDKNQLLHFS